MAGPENENIFEANLSRLLSRAGGEVPRLPPERRAEMLEGLRMKAAELKAKGAPLAQRETGPTAPPEPVAAAGSPLFGSAAERFRSRPAPGASMGPSGGEGFDLLSSPVAVEEGEAEEEPAGGGGFLIGQFPAWGISGFAHAAMLLLSLLWVWQYMALPAPPEHRADIFTPPPPRKPPENQKVVDIKTNVMVSSEDVTIEAPVIQHEEVEISDQFETADPEEIPDTQSARGQEDYFDTRPAGAPGYAGVMGMGASGAGGSGAVGSGSGSGKFGTQRGGGRKARALRGGGGTAASEDAVERALAWLARHQESDGHWDAARYGSQIGIHTHVNDVMSHDVAVTGLAVLAFLGAGHTESQGKYATNVRKALYWLEEKQDKNTGYWNCSHYSQGIAALAVAEGYGMDGSHPRMAQLAIDYLVKAQGDAGGWNYYVDKARGKARSDTSISGWCTMALKSAKMGGLKVPDETFQRVKKYFGGMGADDYGKGGEGDVFYEVQPAKEGGGMVKRFSSHGPPTVTAITMLSLMFLGTPPSNPWMQKKAEYLKASGDARKPTGVNLNNFYYLYYATLTAFQIGDPLWSWWNQNLRDPLIALQAKGGDDDGSWSPERCKPFGKNGGRVYTTALGAMILEVYYRYLPVYR